MSSPIFFLQKKTKRVGGGKDAVAMNFVFLERERLLSKILGDPIVGSVRNKKEGCSTRRGLRVGSDFGSFRQTP